MKKTLLLFGITSLTIFFLIGIYSMIEFESGISSEIPKKIYEKLEEEFDNIECSYEKDVLTIVIYSESTDGNCTLNDFETFREVYRILRESDFKEDISKVIVKTINKNGKEIFYEGRVADSIKNTIIDYNKTDGDKTDSSKNVEKIDKDNFYDYINECVAGRDLIFSEISYNQDRIEITVKTEEQTVDFDTVEMFCHEISNYLKDENVSSVLRISFGNSTDVLYYVDYDYCHGDFSAWVNPLIRDDFIRQAGPEMDY